MRPGIATTLRLVGPLIEVICIAVLFGVRGRGYRVLGAPAETLLYAGIGVGLATVLAGLVLAKLPARPADRWDRPRDEPGR